MFKNKGKYILIFVVIVQLILPLGLLLYQSNIQKKLDNMEPNVRIKIASIGVDTETIEIQFEIDYDTGYFVNEDSGNIDEFSYIIFEDSETEYSRYSYSNEKPNHNKYVRYANYYELYSMTKPLKGEFSRFGDYYMVLYDRENEASNIAHHVCEGPETEAYAELTVHNGRFILKDAYVNGIRLDDYLTAYDKGEIDIQRYQYNYFDDFSLEYYDKLDEKSKEIVDNLAGKMLDE